MKVLLILLNNNYNFIIHVIGKVFKKKFNFNLNNEQSSVWLNNLSSVPITNICECVFTFSHYLCLNSSSKSFKGLEPAVSEDNGLKLCLSDKIHFVGPSNRENIKEEIEGIAFYLFIMVGYKSLWSLLCLCDTKTIKKNIYICFIFLISLFYNPTL